MAEEAFWQKNNLYEEILNNRQRKEFWQVIYSFIPPLLAATEKTKTEEKQTERRTE
jgi:hypothetical protein